MLHYRNISRYDNTAWPCLLHGETCVHVSRQWPLYDQNGNDVTMNVVDTLRMDSLWTFKRFFLLDYFWRVLPRGGSKLIVFHSCYILMIRNTGEICTHSKKLTIELLSFFVSSFCFLASFGTKNFVTNKCEKKELKFSKTINLSSEMISCHIAIINLGEFGWDEKKMKEKIIHNSN